MRFLIGLRFFNGATLSLYVDPLLIYIDAGAFLQYRFIEIYYSKDIHK